MTPTRDPEAVEQELRRAFARRAAATTVGEPPRDPVDVDLRGTPGGRPRWRWPATAAAAAVVVVAGALAVTRLTTDPGDRTETRPRAGTSPSCGADLPFAFPAPDGFEGPVPGPSGPLRVTGSMDGADEVGLPSGGFRVHWTAGDASIDVRWPAYPPLDPTTPYNAATTSAVEDAPRRLDDGRTLQSMNLETPLLGTGDCVGLDVMVAAGDAATTVRFMDGIQMALLGPGGALEGPREPLVATSTTADALPDVAPCSRAEPPDLGVVTVEDPPAHLGTYPTPREAVTNFLATEPREFRSGFEEITLPDGSVGYVHRREALPGVPTDELDDALTVIHVVHGAGGWSVADWRRTGC